MPGSLTHSPADVIRAALVALGYGTDPADGAAWPVFVGLEPDSPDECLTVYDTEGRRGPRTMGDGRVNDFHGLQVRVRSRTHPAGYAKARAVAVALDEGVYRYGVTVGGVAYVVLSASRTSDVIALGKQTPESKRSLFTVNAVASVVADPEPADALLDEAGDAILEG